MGGILAFPQHTQELLDLGEVPGVDDPGILLQRAAVSAVLQDVIQLTDLAGEADLVGGQIQEKKVIIGIFLQESPEGLMEGQFILNVQWHELFLLSSVLAVRGRIDPGLCPGVPVPYRRAMPNIPDFPERSRRFPAEHRGKAPSLVRDGALSETVFYW